MKQVFILNLFRYTIIIRNDFICFQYPGVAQSIDSDIDNLMTVLKMTKLAPEELYAESAIAVAQRELAWEVDYIREANNSKRFR